jgi:site-specific DNA recombinase
MGNRVVGYVRQSLDALDDRLAADRQTEDIYGRLDKEPGWALVADVFIDNDLSASGRKARPGFNSMMALVEAGEVDVVLAVDLTRLTRNRRDELRLYEAAKAHKVLLALVNAPDLDLATPTGELVADQLASIARFEIALKGHRQMRANKRRADAGRPAPGPRPFGYEANGTTVRESEAALIRNAYTAVLAGASSSGIAATLNAAGATTSRGNPFDYQSVKQVLTNARYIGVRVHRGVEVGKATWNGLVDEATFRAACSVLTDPARTTNHTGGLKRRLMTGIGQCWKCADGTTVVGGSKGADQPTYRCSKTKHLERDLHDVDHAVESIALARLARADAAELLVDSDSPRLDALSDERVALVARQKEVAAEFADPGSPLTMAQVREITERTTKRIAEIDAQLAHRTRERVLGQLVRANDPTAMWATLSLDRRQAVLTELGTWVIGKGRAGGNSRPGAVRYPSLESYNITWTPSPGITA